MTRYRRRSDGAYDVYVEGQHRGSVQRCVTGWRAYLPNGKPAGRGRDLFAIYKSLREAQKALGVP